MTNCEIHVGQDDWQSRPANVAAFASLVGIKVNIIEGAGHSLLKDYVGQLIDRWLSN